MQMFSAVFQQFPPQAFLTLRRCKLCGGSRSFQRFQTFHQGDITLRFHCASVQVQVLSGAPDKDNPNQVFVIGDGFGLFVYFEKFEDTHFRNGVVKCPESKPRGPRKPKLKKD